MFGNGNLVYLSTNKGLAVIGEHSPIGLTLFALESRLDAVYASHGNRSSGNRATPALVPFFNVSCAIRRIGVQVSRGEFPYQIRYVVVSI